MARRLLRRPGLTAIRDPAERAARATSTTSLARRRRSSSASPAPIVDVGSGGGAPGIPVAAALPDREVVLLEANAPQVRRSSSRWAATFPNVRVVCGRAEEQATDELGVALAKALARRRSPRRVVPAARAPGGAAILFVGPTADARARRAGSRRSSAAASPSSTPGLLVVPKLAPTPPGFPRRPGVARKRPLAW